MANEEDLIGRISLVKQILAWLETKIARATGNYLTELCFEAGEERMRKHDSLKPFHCLSPCPCQL